MNSTDVMRLSSANRESVPSQCKLTEALDDVERESVEKSTDVAASSLVFAVIVEYRVTSADGQGVKLEIDVLEAVEFGVSLECVITTLGGEVQDRGHGAGCFGNSFVQVHLQDSALEKQIVNH